jgi:hypothetical protein
MGIRLPAAAHVFARETQGPVRVVQLFLARYPWHPGGTRYLTRREVAGFIPRAANASLRWSYRGFSTRLLYNFTGEYVTSFNATNPGLSIYRYSTKR